MLTINDLEDITLKNLLNTYRSKRTLLDVNLLSVDSSDVLESAIESSKAEHNLVEYLKKKIRVGGIV